MTRLRLFLIAFTLAAPLVLSFGALGAAKSMKDYKSPLVVLPPIEWVGTDVNSPKAQAYFHGVLETFGFFLLMNFARNPENEQHFSDYRQCAENNRNRDWQISNWLKGYDTNTSIAFRLIRLDIGYVCGEHEGKSNGGWGPLEVVSKREWQDYNAVERKFYVGGYIETALEATVLLQENDLIPKDGRVNSLVQCITNNGVEKILETLEETDVEAQFPMPWTISKAVGSVCEG